MLGNYVIGIDPGNNLGIAIIKVDKDLNVTDIETRCIDLTKAIKNPDYAVVEKNIYLEFVISELIQNYAPITIGCEDCFKSKFANAVIQLSQFIITIRKTVYKELGTYPINVYPPKYVKSKIGGDGTANKFGMLRAVKKIEELKDYVKENITEHEVDAMAIGYLALQDFRDGIVRSLLY